MFELKILSDLSMLPKKVETNIDEVQPVIAAAIAKLDGLVVTDNKADIIAADEDAAKLRKMKQAIQRFRIDHVALWKEPMEEFERKCKDSEAKLGEAADKIAAKTGEVKELWRQRKREKCREVWTAKLTEAFSEEIVTCNHARAFFMTWTDPKTKGTWVNSSTSMASIEAQIAAEIERMNAAIDAVEANYSGQPEEVLAKARMALLNHFDMADVIQAVNAWRAEQAAIAKQAEAERQRKAEEDARMAAAKAALEEKRKAEAAMAAHAGGQGAPVPLDKPAPVASTTPAPAHETPSQPADAAPSKVETYRLAVTGTREALIALKKYGLGLGITFENLDKKEDK